VVVPKKKDKIRVCVNFRDLNRASPKNNFSLPHIDMLVDNAARSSIYYFMDGFSGYNQSKWTPNYDGPYMVKKAFLGGALLLS
jgi:hypothetical protein